MKRQQ
ncbi:hypothetical protein Aduo_012400 [Ancylostoma duodenale]